MALIAVTKMLIWVAVFKLLSVTSPSLKYYLFEVVQGNKHVHSANGKTNNVLTKSGSAMEFVVVEVLA